MGCRLCARPSAPHAFLKRPVQKVILYGTPIDVSDDEALGVIHFLYGREFANECAPMGFAIVPEDVNDEWRRGYVMAAFGISDRSELQI